MDVVICGSRNEFNEKVKDAEVVYGDVRADTLQVAKNLKWVQSGEAGMENMDPAMRTSPVVLTNYQRIFAPGISETAMGLLLCLTRGIAKYYMPQFYKQRTMQHVGTPKSAEHTELVGRTMGIVGMGGVGEARSLAGRITGSTCGWWLPMPNRFPNRTTWRNCMTLDGSRRWFRKCGCLGGGGAAQPQTERIFNEKCSAV